MGISVNIRHFTIINTPYNISYIKRLNIRYIIVDFKNNVPLKHHLFRIHKHYISTAQNDDKM